MENSFRVDVCNPIQYFFDNHLDLFLIHFVVLTSEELLQIVIIVIKDYFEQLLFRFVDNLI